MLNIIIAILVVLYALLFPLHVRLNDIMLWCLGVEPPKVSPDSLKNWREFKESPKGIVLFNHPTFYDQMVMMSGLGEHIRYLTVNKYLPGPCKRIAEKYDSLIVKESGGTTAILKAAVDSRPPGAPTIAISPSGGKPNGPFRTGAFVASSKVLPIIVSYDPPQLWEVGEPLQDKVKDRLFGEKVRSSLRILPAMHRGPDETIESFMNRVRDAMDTAKSSLDSAWAQHPPSPAPLDSPETRGVLLGTSTAFGMIGILTILVGGTLAGIGMIVCSLVSLVYHSSSRPRYLKMVDMGINIPLGVAFSIASLLSGNPTPSLCGIVALGNQALLPNKSNLEHAFLVHGPVIIGFISIYLASLSSALNQNT